MATNPIRAYLPANGTLAGRDRSGVFTATGSGAVRYDPSGTGFIIEEATTNLVTNPWRAVNNTGWSATNGSTARTTSTSYQGPGAGLLTASAANAEEAISISAAASEHYAQAIVRNNAAGTRSCRLFYNGSAIGSGATSVTAGATATITASFTGTGGAANLAVRWTDSANTETFNTYYLGAEAKSYATTPCPYIDSGGTVLTGYAWTGAAHGSTSTRLDSTVSFADTNRVSSTTGSVAERMKSFYDRNDNQNAFIYGQYGLPDDFLQMAIDFGTDQLKTLARSAGTDTQQLSGTGMNDSSWHFIYSGWQTTTIEQRQDSAAKSSMARSGTPTGTPQGSTTVYVGSYHGVSEFAGAAIGPVAIYDRTLTASELDKVQTAAANGANLWTVLGGANQYRNFQLRPVSQ